MAGNPRGLGWQEEAPVLAEADMLGWGEGSGDGDGGCSGGEGATGPPCPGLGPPLQASRAGWGKKAATGPPGIKAATEGPPTHQRFLCLVEMAVLPLWDRSPFL